MTDCACSPESTSYPPTDGSEAARANWPAVASLSFGVFGLVTAEFLPASLLTPMALDLGISDGAAGQAVTATAVVAAIAGPAVVVGTGRIDRRYVVWALSALLIASNLVAALSTNVAMLLVARMALGVALGGFWSLAAALALRLVPAQLLPRAMALIFTGVSVATVCAAPLGAYLSSLWGWRLTFAAAAGCGALALLSQLLTMPRLPPAAAPGFGSFAAVLKRPTVQFGLATVLLVVSAHFAGFTYMRPFLERVSKLDVAGLSFALLAFGVGGFLGNIAGGALSERSGTLAVGAASLLIALAAAALFVAGTSTMLTFAATATWGFAFGAFPVSISAWNTKAALDHAESAGALLLVAFQIAIATGAVLGGILVDAAGPTAVIAYTALAAAAGTTLILSLAHRVR
ncbi:transporter [Aureimonas sp. Leaf454]|uniref:MFS transporter n=1 Tax=Aureimonas sp. Leaf454 TaxID=1736381 RepID=UPI0006FCB6CB|nr:MFS transporter [Aureimonas sp. Leaf454]KQT53311.1 transporter [Aureimonas sp. Leaf454]